jgi:hypothetical protein
MVLLNREVNDYVCRLGFLWKTDHYLDDLAASFSFYTIANSIPTKIVRHEVIRVLKKKDNVLSKGIPYYHHLQPYNELHNTTYLTEIIWQTVCIQMIFARLIPTGFTGNDRSR